jgi:uncharacterized integral membrane protein (TIGR00698 family)
VAGIILGMIFRGLIGNRDLFQKGLSVVPRIFIPVGIIVYGVNLQFHRLDIIPFVAWMQIIIGIIVIFLLGTSIAGKLRLSYGLSLLICVGTAICGASAIALVTPVLESSSEETGIALLTITFWGVLGLFLYPVIDSVVMMSSDNYALFCATTLHQTGLVKIASAQFSDECRQTAMIIKMARICMIIPIIIVLNFLKREFISKKRDENISGPLLAVPWFLWGFVFVGVAFSFLPPLRPFAAGVKPLATILWTMAMTSLGLSIRFRKIASNLINPMVFGLIIWLALIANFFIGYLGMGY